MLCSDQDASAMTVAAVVIGLALTADLDVFDQNAVANLLLAAGQAISTRASLIYTPVPDDSDNLSSRIDELEARLEKLSSSVQQEPANPSDCGH